MTIRKSTTGRLAPDRARDRGGVQSVEIGMRVLSALANAGGESGLGGLARNVGMPPAKTHRYLASLIESGFVDRIEGANRYTLGSQCLRVGLVALGRLDIVESSAAEMQRLRDRIEASLLLAVWGARGPIIVRWIDSTQPVTVNVRVGSQMPILRSATGLVFGAFMPETDVAPIIEHEVRGLSKKERLAFSRRRLDQRFARVRRDGLGQVSGAMMPGVLAVAAPIFDRENKLAAVIAALGPAGFFDNSIDGRPARELLLCAHTLSKRFGRSDQAIIQDRGRKEKYD